SLYFVILYSANPKLLHSFPTRRSSDLGPPASPDAHDRRKLRRCADLAPPSGTLSGGAGDIFAIARPSCVQTVASRAEMRDLQKTDRKSTRLNSSHVAISYAVFCVKKK